MIRDCRPRAGVRASTLASLALLIGNSSGFAEESKTFDCGTLALYTMFRLEGKAIDLERLSSHLPVPPSEGFSMRELRDAASGLGLELEGVALRGGDRFEATSAIIHLNRGAHGHYVVIRPAGHSGKVVQLFDSTHDPLIIDLDEFRKSPEWTGLGLIPRRRDRLGYFAVSISLTASAFLIARRLVRRKAQGSPRSSGA